MFRAHQGRYPGDGTGERLVKISDEHARFWTGFANGEVPWTLYKQGEGEDIIMMVDEREGWVEKTAQQIERDLGWGYGRCEGLIKAWEEAGLRGKSGGVLELECLGRKKWKH